MSTPKENVLKVYRHEKTDVAVVQNDVNVVFPFTNIELSQFPNKGYDQFGVLWDVDLNIGGWMPQTGVTLLNDITEWQEVVKIPDVEEIDWEGWIKNLEKNLNPNKATMFFTPVGLFERMHSCMGISEALCALLEEPEAAYDFMGAIADYKIRYIKKVHQYLKPDIIRMSDDYGTGNGPFMSLPTWRDLIKPNLKRIVDAVHEMGMFYRHHTDGVTTPFMDDFIELRIDAVDPWQASNTNIREVKDQYQDQIVFVNGFDNQGVLDMPNISPEKFRVEIEKTLELIAPGGSYLAEIEIFDKSKMPIFYECVEEYNRKYSK